MGIFGTYNFLISRIWIPSGIGRLDPQSDTVGDNRQQNEVVEGFVLHQLQILVNIKKLKFE